MLTLKTELRDVKIKPELIRKAGKIPAVFYGKNEASTPIAISIIDFNKVWKTAGESTVVVLETPDGEKESLIHDVDIDPITGLARHADFYVFEKGHKVSVELSLEFEGVSPAVKDLGGSFVKVLHEIKVEAMPRDLPPHITVDISSLQNFGDQILAKDLVLPNGVTLEEEPDEVIALVSAPREEIIEEPAEIDLSEIEVEKKGKEEGDEEAETSTENVEKEKIE
ncbi:MAG: 50S ribosomal protein L25 [bacterium]